MAVPAILFIFSMSISGVRFFHLIRLAAGGEPPSPQGEGKGKIVSLPVDFYCGQFFK